jgi:hypothetical protein
MRIVILSEPAVAGKLKDLKVLFSEDHQSRRVRTYYGPRSNG